MSDADSIGPNLKPGVQASQWQGRLSASSQAESRAPQVIAESPKPIDPRSQNEERAAELEASVTRLNKYAQSLDRQLEFQLDRESGLTVVTVVDRETGKVVRQIPDELALRLAQKLHRNDPPTLLDIEV